MILNLASIFQSKICKNENFKDCSKLHPEMLFERIFKRFLNTDIGLKKFFFKSL